jgi:predicted nucleotidyltransferase
VDKVILYGSKARGAGDAESDIDLLVLTGRPLTWPEQQQVAKALFPLQLQYNVVLSPLDVSSEEWTSGVYQVLPIRDEVERDGVAV